MQYSHVYLEIANMFKNLSKPQEIKNLENLKSLSEIANFVLNFSETDSANGF